MSLEDLEKQLYSAKQEQKKERSEQKEKTPTEQQTVVSSWREEDVKEFGVEGRKKRKIKRIFFTVGTLIIVLSILSSGMFFFIKYISTPKDVSIDIYSPSDVYRGVPFEVTIQLTNEINSFLDDAKIILNLTPGIISLEQSGGSSRNVLIDQVGSLGGGTLTKRTFKLLSIGDTNSVQKINAELSYKSGGKALFTVKKSKDIFITSPAITLEIKKPEQILGGSKFDLEVNYQNVSNFDFSNVILEAQYPESFVFDSASIPTTSLNNYWNLGELKAGSRGSLQVRGSLNGMSREVSNIPFSIFADFMEKKYLINEQLSSLSISPSPIFIEIMANGKEDYTARIGEEITYVIKYRNDSGIALQDVVLKAGLLGELFDFTTLRTNGDFNSLSGTVTWTASKVPALRLVEPGASGDVEIHIKPNAYYQIKRTSDKNFVLRVDAQIDSPTVPSSFSAEKTSAHIVKETKVMGVMAIDARALYRDPDAGIINTGTFPPRVNRPTEFSVHWILKNYMTDVKNVEVRASLGSGVRWVGLVKSNIDSSPSYNERTQEISWNIEKISAARGILSDPVEAIFKVEMTPNVIEVGQYKEILGKTTFVATDDFTGVDMIGSDAPLSTNLVDDKTVRPEEGRIVQ
jgi:hypothetical protein